MLKVAVAPNTDPLAIDQLFHWASVVEGKPRPLAPSRKAELQVSTASRAPETGFAQEQPNLAAETDETEESVDTAEVPEEPDEAPAAPGAPAAKRRGRKPKGETLPPGVPASGPTTPVLPPPLALAPSPAPALGLVPPSVPAAPPATPAPSFPNAPPAAMPTVPPGPQGADVTGVPSLEDLRSVSLALNGVKVGGAFMVLKKWNCFTVEKLAPELRAQAIQDMLEMMESARG